MVVSKIGNKLQGNPCRMAQDKANISAVSSEPVYLTPLNSLLDVEKTSFKMLF